MDEAHVVRLEQLEEGSTNILVSCLNERLSGGGASNYDDFLSSPPQQEQRSAAMLRS